MNKKKLMSLFAVGCSALLLAGCGDDKKDDKKEEKKANTETLKCVLETEENNMKNTAEVVFTYDKGKKKLVDGNMEMVMDYSKSLEGLTADQKEQSESIMKTALEGMCDSMETDGFKNCKTNFTDGKFEMDMEFDLEKIAEDEDAEFDEEASLEELKELFEDSQGYTCTIK